MNPHKVLFSFISIAGAAAVGGWMVVDIYGSEKLSPIFAAIGFLCIVFGEMESNHIQLMEKLNEPTKPA